MYNLGPLILFVILSNLSNIFPKLRKYLKEKNKRDIYIHSAIIISIFYLLIFLNWNLNLEDFWIIYPVSFLLTFILIFILWIKTIKFKQTFYYFISVIIQDFCIYLMKLYILSIWINLIIAYFVVTVSFAFSHVETSIKKDLNRIILTIPKKNWFYHF